MKVRNKKRAHRLIEIIMMVILILIKVTKRRVKNRVVTCLMERKMIALCPNVLLKNTISNLLALIKVSKALSYQPRIINSHDHACLTNRVIYQLFSINIIP